MDVNNVFLLGDLKEEVYMRVPQGLEVPSSTHVCHLRRSLYGLKQAPRAWFEKFKHTFLQAHFFESMNDPSLFLLYTSLGITILLVYVDDMIITRTDPNSILQLWQTLHASFHMKDLGSLTYFLGLEIHKIQGGPFLNQHKYAKDLIAQARLENTPVDTSFKLNVKYKRDDGNLLLDPTVYRRLVGSLFYLTITRLDISHTVNFVNQFLTQLTNLHLAAVKRIIRYLLGTSEPDLMPTGQGVQTCIGP